MYRTIKSKDQKAIDLKFLSTYEKQSHEILRKKNIHKLQVRGRKQTKSIIRFQLENRYTEILLKRFLKLLSEIYIKKSKINDLNIQ